MHYTMFHFLFTGTGSNAAFVEYTKNIEKWDQCGKDDDPSDIVSSEFQMQKNTKWLKYTCSIWKSLLQVIVQLQYSKINQRCNF